MLIKSKMNSIKAYKALSIVANVEQGNLIKRLLKENKQLVKLLKEKDEELEQMSEWAGEYVEKWESGAICLWEIADEDKKFYLKLEKEGYIEIDHGDYNSEWSPYFADD